MYKSKQFWTLTSLCTLTCPCLPLDYFTLSGAKEITGWLCSWVELRCGHLLVKWKLLVLWKVSYARWCFAGGHRWKDVLLKQVWRIVFLKQTQVKGCLDIADMWKDSWWRSINMTPQTVGDKHWALVWFVSLSSLTTHLYWFALHSFVELNLW